MLAYGRPYLMHDAVSTVVSAVPFLGLGSALAKLTAGVGAVIPALPICVQLASDNIKEEILELGKEGERFSTTSAAVLGWLAFALWLPTNVDGCVAYRLDITRVACPVGYFYYEVPPTMDQVSVDQQPPATMFVGMPVICVGSGTSLGQTPTARGTVTHAGQASDCRNVLHLSMGGTIGSLTGQTPVGQDDLTPDVLAVAGTLIGIMLFRSPKPPDRARTTTKGGDQPNQQSQREPQQASADESQISDRKTDGSPEG